MKRRDFLKGVIAAVAAPSVAVSARRDEVSVDGDALNLTRQYDPLDDDYMDVYYEADRYLVEATPGEPIMDEVLWEYDPMVGDMAPGPRGRRSLLVEYRYPGTESVRTVRWAPINDIPKRLLRKGRK